MPWSLTGETAPSTISTRSGVLDSSRRRGNGGMTDIMRVYHWCASPGCRGGQALRHTTQCEPPPPAAAAAHLRGRGTGRADRAAHGTQLTLVKVGQVVDGQGKRHVAAVHGVDVPTASQPAQWGPVKQTTTTLARWCSNDRAGPEIVAEGVQAGALLLRAAVGLAVCCGKLREPCLRLLATVTQLQATANRFFAGRIFQQAQGAPACRHGARPCWSGRHKNTSGVASV